MPTSLALSEAGEGDGASSPVIAHGEHRAVLCDSTELFDEHARLLKASPLETSSPAALKPPGRARLSPARHRRKATSPYAERLRGSSPDGWGGSRKRSTPTAGGDHREAGQPARHLRFRLGGRWRRASHRLRAQHRLPDEREPEAAGGNGNPRSIDVEARFAAGARLRPAEKRLGKTDRIVFGSTPGISLFAVLERMPEGRVVERFGAVVDRLARPHTPPSPARPGVAGGLITPGGSIARTGSALNGHASP